MKKVVLPLYQKQILTGLVVKKVLDKTVTVAVVRKFRHPIYKKVIQTTKKYLVDDPKNEAKESDRVKIIHVRRLSARKRFRVLKILSSPSLNSTVTK